MKIKTQELEGEQLDHAVAIAMGWEIKLWGAIPVWFQADGEKRFRCIGRDWKPSTNWQQGGPIIEREHFTMWTADDKKTWKVRRFPGIGLEYKGETLLIAAMRCFVAFKLGEEVEL